MDKGLEETIIKAIKISSSVENRHTNEEISFINELLHMEDPIIKAIKEKKTLIYNTKRRNISK